jgi:hypothetical protein
MEELKMKVMRLILLAAVLAVGGMGSAYARDSFGLSVNIGIPGYYASPPAVYYAPPPVVYYEPAPIRYYYQPRAHIYYNSEPRHYYGHNHQWRGHRHHDRHHDRHYDRHHHGHR